MKHYCAFFALSLLFTAACTNNEKTESEKEESVETVLPELQHEVEVITLHPTDFNHELISNGKLSAKRNVDLRFQSAEPIADIYVKNGDYVKKGQKLAELDKFRLTYKTAQAKDALEKAKLELQDVLIGQGYTLEDSARVPENTMKLVRIKSGYDQAQMQYQLALRDEQNATLVAPFDGMVANLFAKQYNTASTGDVFCTIIDNHSLEASFTVLESELPLIKQGDRVEVAPFAVPGVKTEGNITEINPIVDENGMVKVKAKVSDKGKLFEGMNVRVSIHRSLAGQLVIPKDAVVLRNAKQVVFTLVNGKANWIYVHTLLENSSSYTVNERGEGTEGLNDGDVVIISGNINLAHEAPVNVIKK